MVLSFFYTFGVIVSLLIVVFALILCFCMIKAAVIFNKNIRVLDHSQKDNTIGLEYGKKLLDLISIETPSSKNDEKFHVFREKIKEKYPILNSKFTRRKVEGNVIYEYVCKDEDALNILFATHIDTPVEAIMQEPRLTDKHIHGEGTFDSKALLFVMFEAIEDHLKEGSQLNMDLTIVITTDDETTKEGENKIVDLFLREGKFFDLVLEEGSGILNPITSGLRSYYAFVGVGVTGQLQLRFEVSKESFGKQRLMKYINEVQNCNLFKSVMDKNTVKTIKEISKDMSFSDRLILNNIRFFAPIAKKMIEENQMEINKMLKTNIRYGEIVETEKGYYIDVDFFLSTHDDAAYVLLSLDDYMKKYSVNYSIIRKQEKTKVTQTNSKGYKLISKVIDETFNSVYTTPIVLTKTQEARHFDKVSDCVIRFSPLYYSHNAIINKQTNNEYVAFDSLVQAISFFKNLLDEYEKR